MAQNKGAIVRYRAIDRCLRSKHGKYGIEELLPLTGYIRGGCCPIGMHGKANRASSRGKTRPFPSYIDEACLLHEKIYVSAGQRGMQLRLTPQDLIEYVPLEVSDLI